MQKQILMFLTYKKKKTIAAYLLHEAEMQDVLIVIKIDVGEYVGMTRSTRNPRKLFIFALLHS